MELPGQKLCQREVGATFFFYCFMTPGYVKRGSVFSEKHDPLEWAFTYLAALPVCPDSSGDVCVSSVPRPGSLIAGQRRHWESKHTSVRTERGLLAQGG